MRSVVVAALLVALSGIVPAIAVADVQGSPDLDAALADNLVVPGESETLEVTLTNAGDLRVTSEVVGSQVDQDPSLTSEVTTAQSLQATLDSGSAPITINTGTRAVGSLAKGDEATLPYQVEVPDNIEPGTYNLELTVEYTHTLRIDEEEGTRARRTVTKTFDLELVVDDRATFEVVETSTDARIGSDGRIATTIENTGTESARSTTLALESLASDVTFGGSQTTNRFVGRLDPGEQTTVEFRGTVAEDAMRQRYAFEATAMFEDADGLTRESQALDLGVTPRREQRFSIVETKTNVTSGETGTLTVRLRNDGVITTDETTVRIESTNPGIRFGESASESQFVGAWEPGATRTLVFEPTATPEAADRPYALDATVTYTDGRDDTATSRPLSLRITPDPQPTLTLRNVSSSLRAGDEGTIRGIVENTGETSARDLVLRLDDELQNVEPVARTSSVGTVAPGESASFEYAVDVTDSADAGPRQFVFETEYRTSDSYARTTDPLVTQQPIRPDSDTFDVRVDSGTVTTGETGTLNLTVTNTAEEPVRDVSAKLFADDPITVDEDEAFVGELAPGESTTITFRVGASGAVEKSYPVSLDFQYEEPDGDTRVSDTKEVPVVVDTGDDGGGGPPLTLVGIGTVLLVGIGGYIRFRD